MASPAYRSGTSNVVDPAATPVTVTKPTGAVDGDLLIVLINIFTSSPTVSSVPSGWTLLPSAPLLTATNACRSYVYWKVAASEAASWAWGLTANGNCAWACIAVSNPGGGATPLADSQGALDTGGDAAATAPSVTTNATDNLLIYVHARNALGTSASLAAPSGYTTRNWAHNTTADTFAYIATKAPAGAVGATGSIAGDQTSFDTRASSNYHIAVGATSATTWNGSSTVSLTDTVTTAGARLGVTYHGSSTVAMTATVTTVAALERMILVPRVLGSLVLVPRPPDSLVLAPR